MYHYMYKYFWFGLGPGPWIPNYMDQKTGPKYLHVQLSRFKLRTRTIKWVQDKYSNTIFMTQVQVSFE